MTSQGAPDAADEEADEIRFSGFMQGPPTHKFETDGPASPGKRNRPKTESGVSAAAGPSKKDSSSSSSSVELLGQEPRLRKNYINDSDNDKPLRKESMSSSWC